MKKQKSPNPANTKPARKPPTMTIAQVSKKIGGGAMEVFRRAYRLAHNGALDIQKVLADFRAHKAGEKLALYVRTFLRKFTDGDPAALAV